MNFKFFYAIILNLLFVSTNLFPETTILNPEISIDADLHMEYIFDAENKFDIKKLLENQQKGNINWKKVPYHGFSFGHVTEPIWLKLTVKNPGDKQKFYLSVLYPPTDIIHFFIPEKNIQKSEGMKITKKKIIPTPNHYFPFEIDKNETLTIYLNVHTKYNLFSTSKLTPESDLIYILIKDNSPNIVFFIISILIIILNIFYYIFNRHLIHLYFTGYVFFVLFYQIEILGYAWLLGIYDFTTNEILMHSTMEVSTFFNLYFIIHLFNLHENFPRLTKFYKFISWFVFTGMFFYITGNDGLTRIINSYYMIALFMSYYYIAFYYLIKKRTGSLIFIISWSFAMLGYLIFAFINLGYLPLDISYVHTTIILGTLELIGITYLIPSYGALTAVMRIKENLITKTVTAVFPEKYQKIHIMNRFNHLMKEEELFLEWDAGINLFAERMNIPAHVLSSYISQEEKTGFRNILNQHRINYAKKLMENNPEETIISILYRSGFNSKATFNRVFKEITGQTPHDYKSNLGKMDISSLSN